MGLLMVVYPTRYVDWAFSGRKNPSVIDRALASWMQR